MADASIREQIAELEKEISTTKYNKRTQGHVGLVKAKIALLKEKLEKRASNSKAGEGYAVRKTGDGTAVLLGFPSTGKSTLLNKITNAESDVGAYAFTTLTVIPGMLPYKHAKIQILDVPGIISGAASGSGRGKEVLQVIRTADLIIIVVDVFHPEQFEKIKKEVYDSGVRINKTKPFVKIRRTAKNGIRVGATVPLDITEEQIQQICKAFRIINAEILIRSQINEDDFIDVIQSNKVYLPSVTILTKVDIADEGSLKRAREMVRPDLEVSAHSGKNIAELKDLIFDKMSFIRIFLKEVNKKADMDEPMIMQKGQSLGDLCQKLHKDFLTRFQFARVWGKSAKFDGQKILKKTHELKDNDIIELHLR